MELNEAASVISMLMNNMPDMVPQLEVGLAAALYREEAAHVMMRRTGVPAAFAGLANPQSLLRAAALFQPSGEPVAPPLPAQTLVSLLKQPLFVGEARRLVLEQLARHYQRSFRDQWDFVRFAEERKLGLDFTTPPQRPGTLTRSLGLIANAISRVSSWVGQNKGRAGRPSGRT